MLQREHSVIVSTFNKLPFVIKIFALSTFEWPFNTGSKILCKKFPSIRARKGLRFLLVCFFNQDSEKMHIFRPRENHVLNLKRIIMENAFTKYAL